MAEQNNNLKQIQQYRKKHTRCRYCVFHKFQDIPMGYGYWKCILKDKYLHEYLINFLYNLQGCFCPWFMAKEGNIEI